MIRPLIDSAIIVESLSATSKGAALDEIVECAAEGGVVGKPLRKRVREMLDERESKGSTGIGNGIAVPHVKLEGIESVAMTLARSAGGVEYDAVDGRPVHTVFLIVSPASAAEDHLTVLRWISGLARDADFRRFIQVCQDEGAIRELLHEMSSD